ncbi:MAG TPA: hypothetical protein VM915_13390 [Verrucomicrobiae bacterium]|nr:hypothetical protein [Verrucomicrobiae bacterium]
MRALVLGLCLAIAACGQSSAPSTDTEAPSGPVSADALFRYGGGFAPVLVENIDPTNYMPPPTWFICDSIDGPDIFVANTPDEGGAFILARFDKNTQQAQRTMMITSGAPFAAPNGPAQTFTDGAGTQGIIYTLDAARMSAPEAATTTPVIGLDFAGEEFNCRWFEHMAFIGFTNMQSVVVRKVGDAIDLMTFAFDSEGALMVEMQHGEQSTIVDISAANGHESGGHNREDVVQWGFVVGDGATSYGVWTVPEAPAVFQVTQNGVITTTEEFQAYALAR